MRSKNASGRVETRRFTFERRRGRFVARNPFYRRQSCGTLASFKLERPVFGGRSMGARAAVMAATQLCTTLRRYQKIERVKLVLISYPLQGPKDVRDQILLDLPDRFEVMFIVGDKDAMCPLDLLEGVRERMRAWSRVVVVKGAGHGMDCGSKTREVGEETGRVAARWVNGEMEEDEGGVVYVGGEE